MAKIKLNVDERIIVPIVDLLNNKVDRIKYKPGFNALSISSDGGNSKAYSVILFKLLELMIMDVIAGDIVYFNKKIKSMFYVDYEAAPDFVIQGKNIKKDLKTPLIDMRMTNYRFPFIAFDPGYKNSSPCKCIIPNYLYVMLIEEINKGRKYPKSTKNFWKNKQI
jgi:hypothetical protein